MSLLDEARVGRLEGLRSLRDVLARQIEFPEGEHEQTASLARQLREVLREIAEIEKALSKGSAVDELVDRRKARRADAAGVGAAGRAGDEFGG